jgi:hypothetical protein
LKIKVLIIIVIFLPSFAFSQVEFTIGGSLGGGSFSGNSSSVGGFTTNFYVETNIPLFSEVYPRAGFFFIKDFNAILPNTYKPYFPYLMGFSLKGVTYQFFDNKIFLEEGVGLLALNDRTFSDTNIWDYGVIFSLSAGYDLRNFNLKGIKVGLGVDYGITFFNTLPQFSSINVFVHYTI